MVNRAVRRRCYLTHSLWRDLSDRISHFLDEITLGELVRQAEVKQIAERQDKQKQWHCLWGTSWIWMRSVSLLTRVDVLPTESRVIE